MPIHTGNDSKGPFVQWGHQKKYYYKRGNKRSLTNAKRKAQQQMRAIFASGYHESVLNNSKFNLILENVYFNLINESSDTLKFFIANDKNECRNFILNNYLNQDNKYRLFQNDYTNMIYCKSEFDHGFLHINPNIRYFVLFDNDHFVGCVKYWINGSIYKLPTLGWISINNQFKHQGYGTYLVKKVLDYHKENLGDTPLLLTEFSDEGEPYIKHIIEQFAKEYGIELFMFDDMRKLWEQEKYRSKK